MKVKCIKDTIGYESGKIYESSGIADRGVNWYNHLEYFQEVKEEEVKKPRWKVGSRIIRDETDIEYFAVAIIDCITFERGIFRYFIGDTRAIKETNWREPTPEELKTYFR